MFIKAAVIVAILSILTVSSHILNGYYVKVARWRKSPGVVTPKLLDTTLLTHCTFYFAEIDADGNVKTADTGDARVYEEFHYWARSSQNPSLKTLLSIGGWDLNTNDITKTYFSEVAADETKRNNFASSAVAFVNKYSFNGISLDWFFPGLVSQGGTADDKANYVLLVQALRTAIDESSTPLTLAITVAGNVDVADDGYDVEAIAPLVDFINVITYDYTGDWASSTEVATGYSSLVDSMDYWRIQGAPKEKLLLSVATFGRSFTVADADSNAAEVGLAVNGTGDALVASSTPGMVAYYEILTLQKDSETKTAVDDESGVTVMAYNSDQWLSYDSIEHVTKKTEYAIEESLGGVMIWSLDFDDFSNGYPITTAVSETLGIEMESTPDPTDSAVSLSFSLFTLVMGIVLMLTVC